MLGASSELSAPLPQPQIVCPGLGLLLVHVAGPFRQISGMEVGEGMELNLSVHSVFCFTLLFECVLQGNVVYR